MRNFKVVAALVAVLCLVLAVGVGGAAAQKSSGVYVCAYGKKAGNAGNIYIALGVQPKSVGKYFCDTFNKSFKGTKENIHSSLGTGTMYCKYRYKKNSLNVVSVVYADKAATGKAFCNAYHPKGWKKI